MNIISKYYYKIILVYFGENSTNFYNIFSKIAEILLDRNFIKKIIFAFFINKIICFFIVILRDAI